MNISLTELREILAAFAEIPILRQQVRQLLTESVALKQQILDLLADDAIKLAKAKELYTKSEIAEARLRAGLPKTAP